MADPSSLSTVDGSPPPPISALELLRLHQPLLRNIVGTASDEYIDPDLGEENGYAIQSIRFHDSEPAMFADLITFKAVLILASLASLKFHQLFATAPGGATRSAGLNPDDEAFSVGTSDHAGAVINISLTAQQLDLQPIPSLIDLIVAQLNRELDLDNGPGRVQEACLLIDLSSTLDDHAVKSKAEGATWRADQSHSFPLVLQLSNGDHLKLTAHPNPTQMIHPDLASWFLLHTVHFFDQISRLSTQKDGSQPLKAHTARLGTLPHKVSELEKDLILKLSRPALTADQINSSRPKFVQHFLGSNSLVELVLRSAQINETLIALHWFERAQHSHSSINDKLDRQDQNLELKLTFKQFAQYSYILSEHISKFIWEIGDGKQPLEGDENPTVCLLMNKNPWLVLIMFAVSLSGSSYLNLELSTPRNRIKSILGNLKISLVLTFESYNSQHFGFDQNTHTLQKEQLDFGNILDLSAYCLDLQAQFGLCKEMSATTHPDETKNLLTKRPLEILELYELRMREIEERYGYPTGRKQIAYIVYTSGTTGQPKPIKISNSNLLQFLFNYALRFQRKNDGLTRVLQFASYSFDVSVMSIWDTLAHGSTICMTTEENMKADLIGTMIWLRCTTVDLTPTVLDILMQDDLFRSTANLSRERVVEKWAAEGFYLNHLNTGAEPVSADVRRQFLSRGVSVCVDYGPSETTVGVISSLTLNDCSRSSLDDIGRPTCLNEIYILEPFQGELVPLGGVGEICVGGAQVAGGYADSALSLGKFVELNLDGLVPVRLYRTGDLGKFLPSGSEGYGSICCLGRIDSQVKISGVRIEMGEVEQRFNQLANRVPSLNGHRLRVVISKWDGDETRTTGLVCFVELNSQILTSSRRQRVCLPLPFVGPELKIIDLGEGEEWFEGLIAELKEAVADDLPGCMIPRYWVAVNRIPVNYAGKIDRRALACSLETHFRNRSQGTSQVGQGIGDMGRFERMATESWCVGLGHSGPRSRFRDQDNFVRLGGDSIGMMRAVGVIRKNGINVRFSALAQAVDFSAFVKVLQEQEQKQEGGFCQVRSRTDEQKTSTKSYAPFDLLTSAECGTILDHLVQVHSITKDEIDDCYPTSPTQTGIISASLEDDYEQDDEKVGIYFSQAVYIIDPSFSNELLVTSMLQLISNHAALRTIFVWPDSLPDIFQIVLNYSSGRVEKNIKVVKLAKEEEYPGELEAYLKEDRDRRKFKWGRHSVSARIFECQDSKQRRLVWSLHHALSDGWTLEILMRELSELCRRASCHSSSIDLSLPTETTTRYSEFIEVWRKRSDVHQHETHRFWKVYLEGVERKSDGSAFITTQHKSIRWLGQKELEKLKLFHGITPAVAIRLAVAIGLFNAGLVGPDVLFGMVRSGREIELERGRLAEDAVGCCVSVLPIRTKLWDQRFRGMSLLEALNQEKNIEDEIRKHQMISMGELGRLIVGHGEWLDTLLTIQSWDSTEQRRPIKQPPDLIRMPTRFKLSIEVTLEADKDAITVDVFYDNRSFMTQDQCLHREKPTADFMADGLLAHLVSSFNHLSNHYHQPVKSILNPALPTERTGSIALSLESQSRKNQSLPVDERHLQSIDLNRVGNRQDHQETLKMARMREIWIEILGLRTGNPFGLDRSFESLGGDSIGMMRLIKRIKDEFYQESSAPKSTSVNGPTTIEGSPTHCCIREHLGNDNSHLTMNQIKIKRLFHEIKNGIKFNDLVRLI
ncbi:hypothetical protein PSTG_01312 [Puccinia striiformis f. sp. tritici PST-78]|uniref:Carrier domain-containing protein n=1 Tax=Puccinia striiformis f. sp. tritici PST-78 TaxID=1165861 RepID=A0A0L0W2M7_9BASI|nr:hypothetical protein PSTG_01312 [Puccinia striiformis f. sp. tritici PST-78]